MPATSLAFERCSYKVSTQGKLTHKIATFPYCVVKLIIVYCQYANLYGFDIKNTDISSLF